MIRYWGYPAEDHNATTKDGYILGLQRIPQGIKGKQILSVIKLKDTCAVITMPSLNLQRIADHS